MPDPITILYKRKMAEPGNIAFGRYLRALRERRGLSLLEVASQSQAFAETLNKGYLSRCENGHQRLAFAKLIPLGRIYKVAADVLLERLELDLELERVGAPNTEGLDLVELRRLGSKALDQGKRWDGYGYLRAAIERSKVDSIMERYLSRDEQVANAYINCASAAKGLGRFDFALHEYRAFESLECLGLRSKCFLFVCLSQTSRHLGASDSARDYAELALRTAEECGDLECLSTAHAARAMQALSDKDLELAVLHEKKTYNASKQAGLDVDCARSLLNLSQLHHDLERFNSARRSAAAAAKLVSDRGPSRIGALAHIMIGILDERDTKYDLATEHWREAARIARALQDRTLRFKAEYRLLRAASDAGDEAVARSIHRRLKRLSRWIPKSTPELSEFEQLTLTS